jgi:hypothetical protein
VIIEYRCFGTMIAMFFVARLINRIDNRLFILVGFLLNRRCSAGGFTERYSSIF